MMTTKIKVKKNLRVKSLACLNYCYLELMILNLGTELKMACFVSGLINNKKWYTRVDLNHRPLPCQVLFGGHVYILILLCNQLFMDNFF
jgi:hypothetical protein